MYEALILGTAITAFMCVVGHSIIYNLKKIGKYLIDYYLKRIKEEE